MMTVSIVAGRVTMVGDHQVEAAGYAPVFAKIGIGEQVLEKIHVPAAAEAFLVPGRDVVLHVTGPGRDGSRVLFALESGGTFHDFTREMQNTARRERQRAIVILVALMVLSGATLLGVMVWPLFIALLLAILPAVTVPGVEEMHGHVARIRSGRPAAGLVRGASGRAA